MYSWCLPIFSSCPTFFSLSHNHLNSSDRGLPPTRPVSRVSLPGEGQKCHSWCLSINYSSCPTFFTITHLSSQEGVFTNQASVSKVSFLGGEQCHAVSGNVFLMSLHQLYRLSHFTQPLPPPSQLIRQECGEMPYSSSLSLSQHLPPPPSPFQLMRQCSLPGCWEHCFLDVFPSTILLLVPLSPASPITISTNQTGLPEDQAWLLGHFSHHLGIMTSAVSITDQNPSSWRSCVLGRKQEVGMDFGPGSVLQNATVKVTSTLTAFLTHTQP